MMHMHDMYKALRHVRLQLELSNDYII